MVPLTALSLGKSQKKIGELHTIGLAQSALKRKKKRMVLVLWAIVNLRLFQVPLQEKRPVLLLAGLKPFSVVVKEIHF